MRFVPVVLILVALVAYSQGSTTVDPEVSTVPDANPSGGEGGGSTGVYPRRFIAALLKVVASVRGSLITGPSVLKNVLQFFNLFAKMHNLYKTATRGMPAGVTK